MIPPYDRNSFQLHLFSKITLQGQHFKDSYLIQLSEKRIFTVQSPSAIWWSLLKVTHSIHFWNIFYHSHINHINCKWRYDKTPHESFHGEHFHLNYETLWKSIKYDLFLSSPERKMFNNHKLPHFCCSYDL